MKDASRQFCGECGFLMTRTSSGALIHPGHPCSRASDGIDVKEIRRQALIEAADDIDFWGQQMAKSTARWTASWAADRLRDRANSDGVT